MTSPRNRRFAAAALAGLLVLGGCGPGDDAVPSADAPSAAATATATAGTGEDADGFTAEEREVINAVKAYHDAILLRGTKSIETTLKGRATDELFDRIVPELKASSEDKGLVFIGTYTLEPEVVTIRGDSAELRGCLDTTTSALVERGQTEAGPGAVLGKRSAMKYGLVKVDGVWRVDDPFRTSEAC